MSDRVKQARKILFKTIATGVQAMQLGREIKFNASQTKSRGAFKH